ncbi:MAG: hypothetical protein RMK20_12090, partial [Verrucomicrobiales bacterium]|nr:hypothetical protein [Verrucomicrobiales bacterium]
MNHPKSKIRNPNPVLSRNSETSAVRARSVLECGDPLRLLSPGELVRPAAPSEVRARSAARSPR